MSNVKITDLPSAGTILGTEQFELVQSGTTSANAALSTLLAWKTPNPVAVTSDYTANNMDLVIADTTSAPFTITLPVSPAFGNTIWIVDGGGTWNTNNLSINGNGAKILGEDATLIASSARDNFSLIYYNSSQGWIVGD